ncbi:hypothetical protein ACFRCI_17075 [Streptomyces sp. NPDC056638]|uniref:hypothetical protein n=1 Tax=Streptomyces sp. NPDC056638 TaxID=3345887 RepID=UPI0036AD25A1
MSCTITGYPDHYIVNGDASECPCPEHSSKPARQALEELGHLVGSPEYDVWYGLLLDRHEIESLQRMVINMANRVLPLGDVTTIDLTNIPKDSITVTVQVEEDGLKEKILKAIQEEEGYMQRSVLKEFYTAAGNSKRRIGVYREVLEMMESN